ncbi:amidohydrolase [bacterium]|nr:amidohydrolase [bacterium]
MEMLIDAHLHLRDDVYVGEEGTPENLVKLMDEVGIGKAVLLRLYVPARKAIEELEEAKRKYPDRFIPFAYALPDFRESVLPLIEEAIERKGFKGIKIHAGVCRLEDYIVDPIMEMANALSIACLIDPAGDYENTERLARKFPNAKIIVAHLGQYLCKDGSLIDRFIDLSKTYPNLYLDISGVVLMEKVKKAMEEVGANRIIWGTDGPSNQPDPVTFTRQELLKVRELGFSEEENRMIFGGTIACLLGIEDTNI